MSHDFKRSPLEVEDYGAGPSWLARFKREWWDAHPELRRQDHETEYQHALRLKRWCLSNGMARMTGVHEDEDEDDLPFRVPGEDDE